MKQQLDCQLSTMHERRAFVLRVRFGLYDGIPKTLEETAVLYTKKFYKEERPPVAPERIRQLEAAGLRTLRHPGRFKKLKKPTERQNQTTRYCNLYNAIKRR